MACLIVPAVAAVITTTVRKRIPAEYHVDWLLLMLWGGTLMLIVDHVLNGEIVPYFPFFTASYKTILLEILRIGIPMAVVILCFWAAMVYCSISATKKSAKTLKNIIKV